MNALFHRRSILLGTALLMAIGTCGAFAHGAAPHDHASLLAASDGSENAYLTENDAAMDKMMADMEAKPSGDVDRDFVAVMTPHHQAPSTWR